MGFLFFGGFLKLKPSTLLLLFNDVSSHFLIIKFLSNEKFKFVHLNYKSNSQRLLLKPFF